MTTPESETLQQVWYARVQEFRASGLSGPQWCQPRGLKVKQLHYWNRKFRTPDATASDTTWVAVNTAPPPESALMVSVGPAIIAVRPGFDSTLLQRVVQVLATC
jgi:hypothetical protein